MERGSVICKPRLIGPSPGGPLLTYDAYIYDPAGNPGRLREQVDILLSLGGIVQRAERNGRHIPVCRLLQCRWGVHRPKHGNVAHGMRVSG